MFILKYFGSVFGGIIGAIFMLLISPIIAIALIVYGILGRVSLFSKNKNGGISFISIIG